MISWLVRMLLFLECGLSKCKIEGLGMPMENSYRYFENRECQYFPCHKGVDEFNCMFCYCPLYGKEKCPGTPEYVERIGKRIKICDNCTFPHKAENYDVIVQILSKIQ